MLFVQKQSTARIDSPCDTQNQLLSESWIETHKIQEISVSLAWNKYAWYPKQDPWKKKPENANLLKMEMFYKTKPQKKDGPRKILTWATSLGENMGISHT